jgi:CheY-like chemotaxis protein
MKDRLPRVLVVDDEPDMCWALATILRPAGYVVTTTVKGTEVAELIGRESYAAAFVDAVLSDTDGLEVAALIRQRSPQTAIFLISAYYYQEDPVIGEGLRHGLFRGFVAKPFNVGEVRRMVQHALESSGGLGQCPVSW